MKTELPRTITRLSQMSTKERNQGNQLEMVLENKKKKKKKKNKRFRIPNTKI